MARAKRKQKKRRQGQTLRTEAALKRLRHVAVLVLGDVGRSPRMQFHSLSLANMKDTKVTLIGFRGEECIPAVESHPQITKVLLRPFPSNIPRIFFLLYAPIKVIVQIVQLLFTLLVGISSPDYFLVQNPPSIPTLAIVWLAALLRGGQIVIDWHNLGYTVLQLSIGERHPLVKIARTYERFFGRKAAHHFCVTKSMQHWLRENWDIEPVVLYDKPPDIFQPTALHVRHQLVKSLSEVQDIQFPGTLEGCNDAAEQTLVTLQRKSGEIALRDDRPAIIVSSTSWTPDEDFGILLDALVGLHKRIESLSVSTFPNLLVLVTGKGPQKEMYLQKIRQLGLTRIQIRTMWLEAKDYPLLLGSCDLGVCLHRSSSGIDLPMKVLDMFGSGLPVCAIKYNCIGELVQHGRNGMVFEGSTQLEQQIFTLLKGFPKPTRSYETLKEGVRAFGKLRWKQNWQECAAPTFR